MESIDISLQEEKLIKFLRHVGSGKVKLKVCEGQPVLICEAIRTHRLQGNEQKKKKKRSSGQWRKTRVWRAQ